MAHAAGFANVLSTFNNPTKNITSHHELHGHIAAPSNDHQKQQQLVIQSKAMTYHGMHSNGEYSKDDLMDAVCVRQGDAHKLMIRKDMMHKSNQFPSRRRSRQPPQQQPIMSQPSTARLLALR